MTIEHILQMGYYPDSFARHGLPPDTFFIHFEAEDFTSALLELPARASDLREACIDKYKLNRGGAAFDVQDCFWSCDTRVEDLLHICDGCARPCDDCECDPDEGGPSCPDCESEL